MPIRLASLDMAGTTIDEGGAVYAVLRDAVEAATRREVSDDLLSRWSGTEKREAIVGLLGEIGASEIDPDDVFRTFSSSLADAYATHPPVLLPGIDDAVRTLRASGVAVALQTGYRRAVAESMLDAVGWRVGGDVDALVAAEDVAASRPMPYLVFRTMEATGTADVADVLVAGDTVNDVLAGSRAGARIVVGVLTGAHSEETLAAAGAVLLPSVASIPDLLAVDAPDSEDLALTRR